MEDGEIEPASHHPTLLRLQIAHNTGTPSYDPKLFFHSNKSYFMKIDQEFMKWDTETWKKLLNLTRILVWVNWHWYSLVNDFWHFAISIWLRDLLQSKSTIDYCPILKFVEVMLKNVNYTPINSANPHIVQCKCQMIKKAP